jgi:hypothetical protein
MPLTYHEIIAERMKLPPQEPADLADRLWISVDAPAVVATAWASS